MNIWIKVAQASIILVTEIISILKEFEQEGEQ